MMYYRILGGYIFNKKVVKPTLKFPQVNKIQIKLKLHSFIVLLFTRTSK